ncbi:saccharopine dehydrogenase C-terminal domain-containing protein [Kordiimonas gwangyangensis]|uniref:saccharopine dehydrogenase C-terminal domain-containing protein n=1 Tax=Kordiimonas gwangyangensis TaxID=288022 RepID=UPI00037128E0|nr:saccharopine dehydrogenase C-terminal domain-containing protein [Kordiimonas gwangyangensis]
MTDTQHIHWIGAGLASGPGLVALASELGNVTVWDMSDERAKMLQGHVAGGNTLEIGELNLDDTDSVAHFKSVLNPGDIVISMLPAALHVTVAEIALEAGTHMVTSSYVDDAMAALDARAKEKGLAFVNEVGLDPGIDHLFAHVIVNAAREAGMLDRGYRIDFVSHCGGIPAEKTDFTYKFSWTPFGVLKALANPARRIEGGEEKVTEKVWHAVSELEIAGETFEVYPNRNSLPYIEEYGLKGEKHLNTFVRGTLRQGGWKEAWAHIFAEVEKGDTVRLKALSQELWNEYRYADGEKDRVVLYVALTASNNDGMEVWSASLALDEVGSGWQTAMARTVSLTVAEAIKAAKRGVFEPGVHAALTDAEEAKKWLRGLKDADVTIRAHNVNL